MPRRPKAGPPYTDVPDEAYVVVTNPWGMYSNPRQRTQHDFNRIASWAQLVLQQAGLGGGRTATIECIYSMGTRDEIIIQFEAGTDIIPLLGEHRWADFAQHCSKPDASTCAFVYNWRNNGDPSNHNWSENYPEHLSLDSVPARRPYPPPSWTTPPFTLTNFVIPIPRPPLPPPEPSGLGNLDRGCQSTVQPTPSPASPQRKDRVEAGEEHVAQDLLQSESTNLFTPYEPPSQHPSHGKFLSGKLPPSDEASSSRALPPPPKFIQKLDPYEMDEDAFKILHWADPAQEDSKAVTLSRTDPPASLGYQPSAKLEAEVNALLHRSSATTPSSLAPGLNNEHDAVGGSSLACSSYQPSEALVSEINAFFGRSTATVSSAPLTTVKRENDEDTGALLAPKTTPVCSGYQPSEALESEINAFLRRSTTTTSSLPPAAIKTEYEDAAPSLVAQAAPAHSSYQPSEELESEVNAFLRRTTARVSSPPTASIKKEYEEDVATLLASTTSQPGPSGSSGYRPSAKLEAEIHAFLQSGKTTVLPLSSVAVVKRECEEDVTTSMGVERMPVGGKKRIKVE